MRATWMPLLVALPVCGCGALIGIEDAVPADAATYVDTGTYVDASDTSVHDDSRDVSSPVDPKLPPLAFSAEVLPNAPAGVHWSGGPAVTGWYGGPHHVFVPAADGTVRHASQLASGWSPWESIDGNVKGDIGAVMWSLDRIDVFGTSAKSGLLVHSWFPYLGGPDGWPWPRTWESPSPGAIASYVAVIARSYGTFDLFSELSPGVPVRLTYDRRFTEWATLAGIESIGGDISVATETAASPEGYDSAPYELAARGKSGQLVVTRWSKAGFAPTQELGPIAGRPTITLRRRSSEFEAPRDVYVTATTDDARLMIWRRRDGAWQAPQKLASGVVGTPCIFSRSSADLVLAYLGSDEKIHWLTFE